MISPSPPTSPPLPVSFLPSKKNLSPPPDNLNIFEPLFYNQSSLKVSDGVLTILVSLVHRHPPLDYLSSIIPTKFTPEITSTVSPPTVVPNPIVEIFESSCPI